MIQSEQGEATYRVSGEEIGRARRADHGAHAAAALKDVDRVEIIRIHYGRTAQRAEDLGNDVDRDLAP